MEPFLVILAVLVFSVLDAIGRAQRKRQQEASAQVEPGTRGGVARAGTGEDVIVPELWEEIRRLARGRAGEDVPPAVPVPVAVPTARPKRVARPAPPPAEQEHPVHKMHAMMGRPLAERRSPLDRPLGESPRQGRAPEVADVRRMLGQGAAALRQGVILEEVLGPPAALRGDPWEPGA